jgi:UDP-GlcNAc3NAcA epimerase
MKKPCLTLRDETEWTETVQAGWNKLVGVGVEEIIHEWKTFVPPAEQPPIFGDGKAGEKIADILGTIHLSIN